VLEELQGYADLRDLETGIEARFSSRCHVRLADDVQFQAGPAERIWKSDKLIPSSLREKLLGAVYCLEDVPNSVDLDGKVTLKSPYINNVHPTRDKGLYSVIPEVLQLALPMFERVLSDMIRPLLRMRIATSVKRGQAEEENADCIWEGDGFHPNSFSEEGHEDHPEKWLAKPTLRTPNAREHYDGDLEVMKDRVSLRGRTLQVIVKLVDIILTPENPRCPDGKWHVEGLH
jgi:hypothetical protein